MGPGVELDSFASASAQAVRIFRSNPKLLIECEHGEPAALRVVHEFAASPAVQRLRRSGPRRDRIDRLAAPLRLLREAEVYLGGGEAARIAAAWKSLDLAALGLTPTRRAVLRALYALACLDGLPVLAARSTVTTVARVEYGVGMSPRTVSKVLPVLADLGLIELEPGQRDGYRSVSARVTIPNLPPAGSGSVPPDLDLSSTTLFAVMDSRRTAQLGREARRAAPGRSRLAQEGGSPRAGGSRPQAPHGSQANV